jgi:hypothetical protein
MKHLARFALVTAFAGSAAAQSYVHDLPAPAPTPSTAERFGRSIAKVGDVDGDGYDDFAIASERGFLGSLGHVQVTSGRTREPIYTVFPTFTSTLGLTVAGPGDVNADGYPDFVVGAPSDDQGGTDAGRVFVYDGFYGHFHGSIVGVNGSEAGAAVSGVGDANFDGHADYAIGAPSAIQLFVGITGGATVRSGDDESVLATMFGTVPGGRAGAAVAGVGDTDGDGHREMLVGAPLADSAHLVSCTNGAVLRTHTQADRYGTAVAGGFDWSFDGFADYAISQPFEDVQVSVPGPVTPDAGSVRMYNGLTGSPLDAMSGVYSNGTLGLSLTTIGDCDLDGALDLVAGGWSHAKLWRSAGGSLEAFTSQGGPAFVASIGDVDGDGRDDYGVGYPDASHPDAQSGRVELYRATTTVVQLEQLGPRDVPGFGRAVDTCGDIDGDGVPDLIVASPFDDKAGPEAGAARVLRGSNGAVLWEFLGGKGEQLGGAVISAGDLNGDGRDDFAVGIPRASLLGGATGAVRAYSGANGATLWTVYGTGIHGRTGAALASAGDVNGDGRPDVIVGEPWYTGAGKRMGRVRVLSGLDGAVLSTYVGPGSSDRAGTSVAGPGDVDGDGVPEVFVGTPGYSSIFPLRFGRVDMIDGMTAAVQWTRYGTDNGAEYGGAVASIGDVDGDGRGDVALGAPGSNSGAGRASALSGANGNAMWSIDGSLSVRALGASLAGVGDIDLDGVPDAATGAPQTQNIVTFELLGRVDVRDGATGASRRAWVGNLLGESLGAGGHDLEADGLPDVMAGSPMLLDEMGRAFSLSPRAFGTAHYGDGTPGCAGPQRLILSASAKIGATFEARCDGVEPGAFGNLLASTGAISPGLDLLGIGALLHVDPFGLFLSKPLAPAVGGVASIALPLPNDAALVGFAFYLQDGFFWSPGCPQLPLGFSSSSGVEVVIQP